MSDERLPSNVGRDGTGRFAPGNRCGRGRRDGSRRNAALRLDDLADGDAEAVLRAVIDAAKSGDVGAANLLLARVWPARRGRPVRFELPPVKSAADVSVALSGLLATVAAGAITPEEAEAVARLLDLQRKSIETANLEGRIAALEEETEAARHEAGARCYGDEA
jgi:hypothetical protein